MKIARFQWQADTLWGIVEDDGVFALSGDIYDMMATHIKNGFAEVENGDVTYPIYQDKKNKSGRLGTLKGVYVYPWSYPILNLLQWQNPFDLIEEYSEPEEALYLVVTSRWSMRGFEGDAMVRIKFEFSIEDQELNLDITIDDIDVDLDWEYFVLPVIAGGFIGFIGGVIGGFVGLAIGGAIGGGLGFAGGALAAGAAAGGPGP